MSSVGLWIIGPILSGVVMVATITTVLICACRRRRIAAEAAQANFQIMQANALQNPNLIQFQNNLQQNQYNMGAETSSWGLNQQNNLFKHSQQTNNFTNTDASNFYANPVSYDPLNPTSGQTQGYSNNF